MWKVKFHVSQVLKILFSRLNKINTDRLTATKSSVLKFTKLYFFCFVFFNFTIAFLHFTGEQKGLGLDSPSVWNQVKYNIIFYFID